MRLSEALDRAHRYNDSRPVAFAAAYWATVGFVLAPLFYGLNQNASLAAGVFGPVSIVLAAVILLITILSISFYIWLHVTNTYRLPPSYWSGLYHYHVIKLWALLGFAVIALVAILVWQVGGPS